LSPPPPSSLAPIKSRMGTFCLAYPGCPGKWPLNKQSFNKQYVNAVCHADNCPICCTL